MITATADTVYSTSLDHSPPSSVYPHSPCKTSSTPAINTTSTDYECYKFEGQVFEFPDQSRWLIDRPLSDMAIQQTCSPCEARQVFTAICTADPRGFYIGIEEAVIKVKVQYVRIPFA
jgi:hypothetical protein